jgi:murein DD-endopeptidase MepM/ murein hydrolase activator NlpD
MRGGGGSDLFHTLSRLVAIGLIGGVAGACSSDAMRFSGDPFANPFSATKSAEPSATGALPDTPVTVPRSSVAAQPLPPLPQTPLRTSAAQPLYNQPPAARVSAVAPKPGNAGWTAYGGTPVTVAQGESLSTIANRYGVPAQAILQANGLSANSQVTAGRQIVIPVYNAVNAQPGAGGTTAASTPRLVPVAPPQIAASEPKRRVRPGQATAVTEEAGPAVRVAGMNPDADKAAKPALTKPAPAKPVPNLIPRKITEVKKPEPVKAAEPKKLPEPVKVAAPKKPEPVKAVEIKKAPEPAKVVEPKRPVEPVKAAKVEAQKPEPVKVAKVEPVKPVKAEPPKAEAVKPVTVEAKAPAKPAQPEPTKVASIAPTAPAPAPAAPAKEPEQTASVSASAPAADFRWPARGRVISGFGNGGNEGINIAVPEGTPVKAAEAGTVAYAGSEVKGYGNLVLIRHDNGYVSAYAHNGELAVKRGEKVKRGQVVAKSGQSGNVTSPQLHFEIRKGQSPVDPTPYLSN